MRPEVEACKISEEGSKSFEGEYAGHRVGYYFESLIHYWLKHVRKVELLAQGLQVVEEGRTLGELDFVFRDEEGCVNHWEVAVKFYLYCEDRKVKGSHYIGPNAQDTFELKRERIFAKQLPLSKEVFPEVSIRQAFVKGRVFYHPEAKKPDELPSGMRSDHLRGVWIHCSELPWLDEAGSDGLRRYHLIEKPHWLSPKCFSVRNSEPLSFQDLSKQLASHFSQLDHPVLLSVLQQEGDIWQEHERVFVAADDYPLVS